MKNVFKVKAIHKIAGIIAVVIAAIVFCFTACGGGGSTPLTSSSDGQPADPPPYIPPEERPVKDRWWSWVDDTSTATLKYSVAEDGVCTITVGGTAEAEVWSAWKAFAAYSYTEKEGARYVYTFEAWTQSGTRELHAQYFENNDDKIWLVEEISISTKRQTYTIYGRALPRLGKDPALRFQCADQLGTFYVKILDIKEYTTGKLTIINFSGNPGLTQNNWLVGGTESKGKDRHLEFCKDAPQSQDGLEWWWGSSVQIKGNTITIPVWESFDEETYPYYTVIPFTGNEMVSANELYLIQFFYSDEYSFDVCDAYTNKVPITFTNGNATIDFGTQMEVDEGWK